MRRSTSEPSSKAAQAVRELQNRQRLCLTGTPLENHLGELWSLFHFLMPGWLGDARRFTQDYRNPIEKHGDEARLAHLRARLRPFLLRRTRNRWPPSCRPRTSSSTGSSCRPPSANATRRYAWPWTARSAMKSSARAGAQPDGHPRGAARCVRSAAICACSRAMPLRRLAAAARASWTACWTCSTS